MTKTNETKLADSQDTKDLSPAMLQQLAEFGKQLHKVSDFVDAVTLPRIDILKGNLYALRILNEHGFMDKTTVRAVGAILNNLFAVIDDMEYETELIAELNIDELLARQETEQDKVLR